MQISVEATGNISRKMTVELSTDQIGKELGKRLKSMRTQVRLDGFRPGKVPLKIVKQRYGHSVLGEIVNDMVPNTFLQAATQEKLNVATYPQFELSPIEMGKAVKYIANFEIYPVFEIAPVDSLQIDRPVAEVNDNDIDTMIETLREQQKTFEVVDRPAEKGDQAKIHFTGTLDGNYFEGGSAKDIEVILGEGRMLAGFEDSLIGMSAGEKKEIDIDFPEDYRAENLKGKTAQFLINPIQISEIKLPDVDEVFMEKFGINDGSMEDFRNNVRKNMQRQLGRAVRQRLKTQVMEGLSNLHHLDLPTGLVDAEVKQLKEEMKQNSGSGDAPFNVSALPDIVFRPRAEERVKLGLIVGELVIQKELKQDDKHIQARLKEEVVEYENPDEAFEHFQEDEKAMTQIRAAVLEDMVVDWVMDIAEIIDCPMSFNEALNASKVADEKKQLDLEKAGSEKINIDVDMEVKAEA